MIRALWNTRSGMQAMQDKLDSVSNNISNSETTGYKKVDVNFKDLVYEQLERNGYPTNKNGSNQHLAGSGTKSTEWLRNDTQGALKTTGKDTDFAIDGVGYFKVTQADGTAAYTRDGSFNLDSTGKLVDANGNSVEVNFSGNNKTLSEGKFVINEDGSIIDNSGSTAVEIGKINIYQPLGQDSMQSVGSSLFTAKVGTQINQVSDSSIRQGFVEASNVDVTTEMTDMLISQRAFELNSKALSTVDKMMGLINSLKA